MKKVLSTMVLAMVLAGLAGCASTPQYQETVSMKAASDSLVDIKVTPVLDERYGITVGYTGMILEVRNKTSQDVVVNWDETMYLQGGEPNGGFSTGGPTGGRLRGFDVVFAGETYVKTIYPTVLVAASSGGTLTQPRLGNHRPMPAGENGIVIKLLAGSQEVLRRLVFTIPG